MQPMSPLEPASTSSGSTANGSVWRGFLAGLFPLGPLAIIIVVALALAALARQLTAGQGFATQQWTALLVIALGLMGAATAYVVFSVRAFRRAREWQQSGIRARANGALAGLVVVAVIVALPVLLAIVMPQHPAPNLAP